MTPAVRVRVPYRSSPSSVSSHLCIKSRYLLTTIFSPRGVVRLPRSMAQALHPTILEMFIDRATYEAYRLGDIPLGYGYFAEGPDPTMFAVNGLNRVLVDADGEEVKDSSIAAMYYAIANFQKKNYGIPVGSLRLHISADCQQRSLLDGSMVLFPDSCSVPFTKRLTPVAYDGFERAVFYDV